MRFDKFTIKSQELIQNAQTLATQYNHQQIEPEHLLASMLSEKEGVAQAILNKLGASPGSVVQKSTEALKRLPKVTGGGAGYASPATQKIMEAAFAQAAKMKDEYVSTEHLLLALADDKNCEAGKND